jgi:hypothetical protein
MGMIVTGTLKVMVDWFKDGLWALSASRMQFRWRKGVMPAALPVLPVEFRKEVLDLLASQVKEGGVRLAPDFLAKQIRDIGVVPMISVLNLPHTSSGVTQTEILGLAVTGANDTEGLEFVTEVLNNQYLCGFARAQFLESLQNRQEGGELSQVVFERMGNFSWNEKQVGWPTFYLKSYQDFWEEVCYRRGLVLEGISDEEGGIPSMAIHQNEILKWLGKPPQDLARQLEAEPLKAVAILAIRPEHFDFAAQVVAAFSVPYALKVLNEIPPENIFRDNGDGDFPEPNWRRSLMNQIFKVAPAMHRGIYRAIKPSVLPLFMGGIDIDGEEQAVDWAKPKKN